jgi:hypothetical protein
LGGGVALEIQILPLKVAWLYKKRDKSVALEKVEEKNPLLRHTFPKIFCDTCCWESDKTSPGEDLGLLHLFTVVLRARKEQPTDPTSKKRQ